MWSLLFIATLAALSGTFEFKAVDPCHDFYESVCEVWNSENATQQIAVEVADVLSSSAELFHHEQQARVLFNSCMNWDAVTHNSSVPLLTMIQEFHTMMQDLRRMNEDLSSWPVLDDDDGAFSDFSRLVQAVSRHYESWPFFSIKAGIDQEQNNNTLLVIDSPEPFYRKLVRENSTEYENILSLYAQLWAQATGKSLDVGALAKEVEHVAWLEEDIAAILRPTAETVTNPLATNNKFKISQLNELFPLVDWSDVLLSFAPAYLHDYIRSDPEVIVKDPEYIRELDSVLARYEERTHFNYAWWQYIVDKLLRPTTAFRGTSTEACVDFTSQNLPEAVDSLYLNRVQPQDDIDDSVVDDVFGDVQAAMLAVLDEASWLDERSREQAQQKVASVRFLSGRYFRHRAAHAQTAYSELSLNASETSVMHTRRIDAWQHGRSMALVGKTAEILDVVQDSAILDNYMYLPSSNVIVAFPGALLQHDIRNPSSSEALYGSLGFILGHEMLHAFDKEGICYGTDGNALELLEPATKEVFEEKLQCVEKLYSSRYLPGTTQFVDGNRTVSENVADIDGLKIALKAYDLHRRREGLPTSNKTEFFKAFARSNCENLTPEAAQLLYAHDEHAPWKVRVNEALRNNDDFSKSFACPEESGMSSADKCYIWSEKPRVDAGKENAVNRITASGLTVMTAVLLAVLNYY